MKARFSCSDVWNMSVVRQGKLYRYSYGKVKKVWKPCYACLRDDTSLRWYTDSDYLQRKGEVWLEELAPRIKVGRAAFNLIAQLRKPSGGPDPKQTVDPDLCIALPDVSDRTQRRWFWFACTSEDHFNQWVSAFSKCLDDRKVHVPPECSGATDRMNSAAELRRLQRRRRHYSSEESPSVWELYWFIYSARDSQEDSKETDSEGGQGSTNGGLLAIVDPRVVALQGPAPVARSEDVESTHDEDALAGDVMELKVEGIV